MSLTSAVGLLSHAVAAASRRSWSLTDRRSPGHEGPGHHGQADDDREDHPVIAVPRLARPEGGAVMKPRRGTDLLPRRRNSVSSIATVTGASAGTSRDTTSRATA